MTNIIPASPASEIPEAAPIPARHDGWTPARQRGFCEALADCGLVDMAAAAVGMSRESAYRLRRRDAGQAFGLAWDMALLLARQRLVDEAYTLAFTGSVEQIFRDGKLIGERRRRDPRMILHTVERLGSKEALGSAPVRAVAQEFDAFLDCMEADAATQSGHSASFMTDRAAQEKFGVRDQLSSSGHLLRSARNRVVGQQQLARPGE